MLVKHVGSECVSERWQEKKQKNHVVLYIISTIFYCIIHSTLCLGYEIQKNTKLSIISTTINILIHLFIYLLTYYLFTYLLIYLSIYQITYLLENCALPGYYMVSSGNNPEECSSQLIMYLFIHLFTLLLSIHPPTHHCTHPPTHPPSYLPTYLPACLYLFIYFICLFYRSLDNNDHSSDFICPLTENKIQEKMWEHLTCFELQL